MLIEDGSPYREKLLKLLEEEYSQERGGTHVSDLILCIREQVFRKLEPQAIDERDLASYALGEGAHVALQRLAEKGSAMAEKEVEVGGVIGTIDLFDGVPIEIKTVRSDDDSVRPFHVTQLKYYMSMTNSNVGILLYLMVNNRGRPFRFRTVTLNDSELTQVRVEIESRAKVFNDAVSTKNPFGAPHVKKDLNLVWKCSYCKYSQKCWSRED